MTSGKFITFEGGEGGTLKGLELYEAGNVQLTSDALSAAALAFVSAFIAIVVMMAWLKRASFTSFLSPSLVVKGFATLGRGHKMGMPKGDVQQLPGVFIFNMDGEFKTRLIGILRFPPFKTVNFKISEF